MNFYVPVAIAFIIASIQARVPKWLKGEACKAFNRQFESDLVLQISGEPMKKTSATERILNTFGWKTVVGRAEYRGFEHLLNPDIPDWRITEPEEEEVVVEARPAVAYIPNLETHNQLLAAIQRVDVLKAKAKEKAKAEGK